MKVPFLDITAQHQPLMADIRAAIERVLTSNTYILGPEVAAFEQAVDQMVAPARTLGMSNGTDALLVALLGLGIGPGDQVIVPGFTFFATASAVIRAGAEPVFADVDERTFNLDPAAFEAAITARTRAVIPVHLYGQCADMDAITAVARKHGLKIIEDAAQALGATYHGRPAAALGDVAAVSFYPTKNLGAIGEAGLLATADPALFERCRILRNQGMEPRYQHHYVGGNFRMDGIQGAVLRVKLGMLASWNQRRNEYARIYDQRLSRVVTTPWVQPGNTHIYHQYTIRTPRRDALKDYLAERGIASEIYYPIPLHCQPCLREYAGAPLPVCERVAAEALSLPIAAQLSPAQIEYVADQIERF